MRQLPVRNERDTKAGKQFSKQPKKVAKKSSQIPEEMTRGVWLLVLSLFVFAVFITTIANATEQTGDLNQNTSDSTVDSNNVSTTNNYNGAGAASRETPPPSAIAPSYISNGPESCLVGSSIGTQVNVFGLSGGFIDKM